MFLLRSLLFVFVLSAGNFTVLAQDGSDKNKTADSWVHAPSAVHSAADVDDAHHHQHHRHGRADIPQYSLTTSFDRTSSTGPFALPAVTQSTATMTVSSATRGQFALKLERDQTSGLVDHTARASFQVPVTAKFAVSGSATLSADRVLNPAYRVSVAPSYILFFIPEGQKIFGQLSVSAETAHYKTANAFSLAPMFTIGSRASGIMVSAGYMFGHLYNADPAATFFSPNQAMATTGPTISVFWPINPQISLAVMAMPKAETTTLFTTADSSLVRVSGSYKFQKGPRLGLAVQHMETSANGIFLNRSLNIEASLTLGF